MTFRLAITYDIDIFTVDLSFQSKDAILAIHEYYSRWLQKELGQKTQLTVSFRARQKDAWSSIWA